MPTSNAPKKNGPRVHGEPPFRAALLHGGPGSIGDMASVAQALASRRGIIEPWGTAGTLEGQLEELLLDLKARATFPIALAGHSWGAWLAYLFAARNPELVSKLILIDCPPMEALYEDRASRAQEERLGPAERMEVNEIFRALPAAAPPEKDSLVERLDVLMTKVYAFDPIPQQEVGEKPRRLPGELFRQARAELTQLRDSGGLLALAKEIRCPVVAIHGDFDPLPAEGVETPLRGTLNDFRFHLLPHCGHTPWKERQAKDAFLRLLDDEL